MENENKPPPDEGWKPANDNYQRQVQDDDSDIPPRQRLDIAVLSIARLIGRQMAREDFERLRAANDNAPGKAQSNGGRGRKGLGLLVFNRVQMVKDPETGKRVSRPNPPEQRQVVEAPHLRIVSDELWDAVQARKKLYGGTRLHERRRPKHMFSGLVRCGCCGASYTIKNREQLACAAHREKGTCTNNRTIRVNELERRVLDGIKRRLLAPEAIAECLTEYHAERGRLMAKARQERQQIDKRLAAIDRQIRNIIDAIAEGVATAGMKSRLIEIEAEKERLSADLGAMAESSNVVELHPVSIEAYRRKVAELQDALQTGDNERREAANIVCSLITSIEDMPHEGRGELELSVHGALAELLNLPNRKTGELPRTALMVAEESLRYPGTVRLCA